MERDAAPARGVRTLAPGRPGSPSGPITGLCLQWLDVVRANRRKPVELMEVLASCAVLASCPVPGSTVPAPKIAAMARRKATRTMKRRRTSLGGSRRVTQLRQSARHSPRFSRGTRGRSGLRGGAMPTARGRNKFQRRSRAIASTASSLRTQGPITSEAVVAERHLPHVSYLHGVWVPAFAETTRRMALRLSQR